MGLKPLFFFILLFGFLHSENFVTYEIPKGRLGDCLLTYLHAKWISHKYNLPLQLNDFKYSYYFAFDPADSHINRNFSQIQNIVDSTPLNISTGKRTKFVVTYFPENPDERELFNRIGEPWPFFPVDWKDVEFRKKIVTLVHPTRPVPIVEVKKDAINVAIHFREGGNHDQPSTRQFFAAKFPAIEYYKNALKEVCSLLPNKKLYCHVFTDAINPGPFVDELRQEYADQENVEFNFLSHKIARRGVVIDFFSIFAFDIVIRPDSNFSLVPTLLKDFAIVVAPKTRLEENSLVVEKECDVQIDSQLLQMLIEQTFDE